MTRIDQLRNIVDSGTAEQVDGFLIDVTTANLVVTCYDLATDRVKTIINTYPLPKVVETAWKVVQS